MTAIDYDKPVPESDPEDGVADWRDEDDLLEEFWYADDEEPTA